MIFAGSLYAWREWNNFVKAVEDYNKLNAFEINITFVGSPSRWAYMPKWINKYGHLTPKEAYNKVTKADIAYLPYWMDKKHEETVKMAFPSKLAFYCTASTPIFYHGPQDSSPALFLDNHSIGVICSSFSNDEIISKLKLLIEDDFISNYGNIIETTYQSYFNKNKASFVFNQIVS